MSKKELNALINKASEGITSKEDMAEAMKFIPQGQAPRSVSHFTKRRWTLNSMSTVVTRN